jgi:RNA polymerase sigma-70 factor (ECF subfamily)
MDRSSFKAFYEEMNRPLWGYVYRRTGSAAAADDVVQNAFYKFLRKPPDSTDHAAQKAYLYRIATRLTKDHWRSSNRRQEQFEQTDYQDREPAALESRDLDLRHDLSVLFEELSEQERSLLWLAYVERYKHREIAEILELQPKSIRVLLHRARKRLEKIMDQANVTAEDLL